MPAQVRGAAARAEPFERAREALREQDRGAGGVRRLAAERLGDAAGAVGVVERELAEHAGAENRYVLPALARRRRDSVEVEERADVDALEALGGRDEQPRPVRRREDQRLGRRLAFELARRVAEVEALDVLEPPLAGQLRRPFGLRERARLVHLGAAEDAPVAGCERLADRGGRAEDVDDDPDRSGRQLAGREGHVDAHAGGYASPDDDDRDPVLLPASRSRDRAVLLGVRTPDLRRLRELWTRRHPLPGSRERPPSSPATRLKPRPVRRAPGIALATGQAPVTKALIAINLAIYLVTAVQGARPQQPGRACSRFISSTRISTAGSSCRTASSRTATGIGS